MVTITLAILFLLISTSAFVKLKTQNQKEIIVYNNTQNRIVQFISGNTNYVVTDKKLSENSFGKKQIHTVSIALRLKQPVYITGESEYRDANMLYKNGNIFFEDKFVIINKLPTDLSQQLKYDIIVIDPPASKELNNYRDDIQFVFTKNNYRYMNNGNKQFYWVENQGAFRKKW